MSKQQTMNNGIRHIVFFKLSNKSLQEELVEKLRGLEEKIDLIQHLEVGENFAVSPRAFDVSLIVDFESKNDLAVYATHKEHLPVVEFIKANGIETKVVDYER
jgi:hypothetical protein